MIPSLYAWFASRSLAEWIVFSFVGNVLVFAASVILCAWLARHYAQRPLFDHPQPVSPQDLGLAALTVLLNTGVAIAGWWLWQQSWITLTHPSVWRSVGDTLLFLLLMDAGMYAFHRLAHHPWLYPWIHSTHHRHQETNALSLFVLNPFEVLGFGSLMIAVLMLLPLSGTAVLTYLFLNTLFGTLGHAGVEPLPGRWCSGLLMRQVGTSTFHAGHHLHMHSNFGFYTVIWDRLFGTLDPAYEQTLRRSDIADSGAASSHRRP